MAITQNITALPPAGHRGVDIRTVFVTKQEAFQDTLQAVTVTQLNSFATQANQLQVEVNATQQLAEDYAVKTAATVETGTYSAKEFALGDLTATGGSAKAWAVDASNPDGIATSGSAKSWATKATTTVDGTSYSSKEYASGDATASGGSAKAWAIDSSSPNGTTDKSAKTLATEAAASASTATTQAGIATTKASEASTSATNAASSASTATTQAVIATSMATVCTNIYDQFDDKYLGAKATPPLLDNDGNALTYGALYFDTTNNFMKVWSNTGWINAGSSVNGTTERYTYHATAGQTVFAATYEAGYIDVFLNGSKLENGVDFTAVTATNITLTSPAALNDVVDIICYAVFELSTAPTKDVVAYTVSTVADLASVPSSYTTAIVKDLNRGGTFIWSSTGTANGGTVFAGATGFWNRQYDGAVNVKWFGAKGDGVTDDSSKFALAFGNTTFNNITVFIPYGTFIIKSPITIPCGGSLVGEGAGSIIKADFSEWVGTDYRAIIVKSKEGINYHGLDYNAQIRDFNLFGINNSTLVSIGVDFRAATVIATGVVVNNAWYNGIMTDVLVSGFDTGINIFEMWCSTLRNVNVMYCRESCTILGKVVNVTFEQIRFTNHELSHTSSTDNMYGLSIHQSDRYIGAEVGRPEGIVVTAGSLIFGATTNLLIGEVLYFRCSKSILDGPSGDCVVIGVADNVEIDGNYIYAVGTGAVGVKLTAVATSDSKISVINNDFVGNYTDSVGVSSWDGARYGCSISNNFFRGFLSPIQLNYFQNGQIVGNYGRANIGNFIYNQSGGNKTVIDNNVSDDSFPIISLHPTTSTDIDIRNNTSANSSTYYKGKVTMLAGATSITLPSNFHVGITNYLYSVTNASPSANIGSFWITNNNSTTPSATLTTASAIAADTVIYYTAIATPYYGL